MNKDSLKSKDVESGGGATPSKHNSYLAKDTIHTSEWPSSGLRANCGASYDPVLVKYLVFIALFLVYNGVLVRAKNASLAKPAA